MVQRSKPPQVPLKGIILVLSIFILVFLLAVRSGKFVEERGNPKLNTIEACGRFCRGECMKAFYDQVRTQLYIEGNQSFCICSCNSTIHSWLVKD